ncbi:RNA polymerase II transcription factor B subunit 3 [Ceratobasidium theobromae]|uniref:RNA polymerase II transcription factor B subunit 3 n=1 Tax=Ceratobasidium theobromae TaxID=1582974 RepID=A0A5N5QTF0_9AGAM|nr:RNA polymerase II transcription factor B subunit 3 [Ceratobasidium theobromae]
MSKKFSWLNTAKTNSGPSSRASPAPVAKATQITINGVKDPTGKTVEFKSDDDVCPLCRSDRFLNPKLRLLVSTCYHRMCESCIDRLFTLGPAPCPTCKTVIRKMGFMPQTFEDLGVEKEVTIRRRIAKFFNKRLEDFEDLHAYNDYLEEVETIGNATAFNLINDIDIAATEARIAEHRAANAALIELNEQREAKDAANLRDIEERERLDRQQRAEEARRAEEEEERERERSKLELINQLESSNAPAERVLAKAKAQQRHREALRNPGSAMPSSSALLRAKAAARAEAAVDVPHVPITDHWSAETHRFTLKESYDDALSAAVRADPRGVMRAGGYIIEQAWGRALSCGVMGLDIPPLRGEDPTPTLAHVHANNGEIASAT